MTGNGIKGRDKRHGQTTTYDQQLSSCISLCLLHFCRLPPHAWPVAQHNTAPALHHVAHPITLACTLHHSPGGTHWQSPAPPASAEPPHAPAVWMQRSGVGTQQRQPPPQQQQPFLHTDLHTGKHTGLNLNPPKPQTPPTSTISSAVRCASSDSLHPNNNSISHAHPSPDPTHSPTHKF